MTDQPEISIGGTLLTQGQTMIVRSALSAFYQQLGYQPPYGQDPITYQMQADHRRACKEVLTLLRGT